MPVLSELIVTLVDPVLSSVAEIDGVPLSEKTTLPVGIPEVDGVTVAVNVMAWPGEDGSGLELMLVLVGVTATVWDTTDEVLDTKLVSP